MEKLIGATGIGSYCTCNIRTTLGHVTQGNFLATNWNAATLRYKLQEKLPCVTRL